MCAVDYLRKSGLCFLDTNLNANFETTYNALGTVLLAATAMTISLVILLCLLDIYGSRNEARTGAAVRTSLKTSISRIQANLSVFEGGQEANTWHDVLPYLKRAHVELVEAACCVDGNFDPDLALQLLLPASCRTLCQGLFCFVFLATLGVPVVA